MYNGSVERWSVPTITCSRFAEADGINPIDCFKKLPLFREHHRRLYIVSIVGSIVKWVVQLRLCASLKVHSTQHTCA